VENLLETLRWCGLAYDAGPEKSDESGPYFQSQRTALYKKYAGQLVAENNAYPCFCSEARLKKMRDEQVHRKITPKYDGTCRKISAQEAAARSESEPHVIRLKVPATGKTTVKDIVRGEIDFQNDMIDDQVLIKSDGFPTYHLANVVDDHLMEISHVIRGEEWLISTPKHLLLYQDLGWEPPVFAHLPLLLNADRSKLSKRQGDVAVEDYREKGYLPQALVNFVALLGWNRGDDQEIFTMDQLVADFSLERVSKSGAVFDQNKLRWMNGIYIRDLPESVYLTLALEAMQKHGVASGNKEQDERIALMVRNKLDVFSDIAEKTALFRQSGRLSYSQEAQHWISLPASQAVFASLKQEVEKYTKIDLEAFRQIMGSVQKITGVKGKELWMPVRAALTGLTEGPELPAVIELLGKEKIADYLAQALKQN
jgi:glutamyl-tRNA synthetase